MGIRTADMDAAVEYLAIDPHPVAIAEYELAAAKTAKEQLFARLHPTTEGTVKERDAQVELNFEYQGARERENLAIRDLANQKSKRIWAQTICELYRTVSANNRTLDRIT